MEKPMLILPSSIPVLRPAAGEQAEYTVYYRNILFPYRDEWDVRADAPYGENFGDFWRITDFPEAGTSFPLRLRVLDAFGNLITAGETRVEVYAASPDEAPFKLMCLGDSMTHGGVFVRRVWEMLPNLETVGLRCFDGVTRHEGRGGWLMRDYFRDHADWWGGVSPFLFPVGIPAEKYWGDLDFNNRVMAQQGDLYSIAGFTVGPLTAGMYFHKDEKILLRTPSGDLPALEAPEWEFSYAKYAARYGTPDPDCVSVLMGANDMQCDYEEHAERIRETVGYMKDLIASLREKVPGCPVIICMPILGGEQYAWHTYGRCGSKCYNLGIRRLNLALLEAFDSREDEGIYICPMLTNHDTVSGLPRAEVNRSLRGSVTEIRRSDPLHPNREGYFMMADSLAAAVEKVRQRK